MRTRDLIRGNTRGLGVSGGQTVRSKEAGRWRPRERGRHTRTKKCAMNRSGMKMAAMAAVVVLGVAAMAAAAAGGAPMASSLRMQEHGASLLGSEVDMAGFTCGQTVPLWLTAKADERGILYAKVVLDAASSGKDSGAGFSDCLSVVPASSDIGALGLTQKRTGSAFDKGSTLVCGVTASGLERGQTVDIMLEVRLACMQGAKPTGDLTVSFGDQRDARSETLTLRKVQDVNGAHSAYLGLVKTITTGDGICGMHDTEELTESYLVDDRRQVKFCYRIVNYGTQAACGVSLHQQNGLEASAEYSVQVPSLGDDCVSGRYDALPGSTTTGRTAIMWSSASAEFLTEYPCGVTEVAPRATLRFHGGEETSASVRLNTANDCTGVSNHATLGGAQASKQMTFCDCVIIDSSFYFLDYVETISGLDLCMVNEALTGYRCLIGVSSPPPGAEVCVIDTASRYVATNRIQDNSAGVLDPNALIGCQLRTVQIIRPVSMTRFSTFV
ncbi:hypothetical protein FVE85_0817 [Porphyridium purpureum]|uniref:Uncharacterized protein n=1 Tax=Porphyridium purpureum TaxID=35688 RepID=A0A5J4Z186_PORPP|nr:hypothetical protein FVE85_0817 [Porphyridium purpureum]|eukprot:POR5441..scf208_2